MMVEYSMRYVKRNAVTPLNIVELTDTLGSRSPSDRWLPKADIAVSHRAISRADDKAFLGRSKFAVYPPWYPLRRRLDFVPS